VSAVHKLVLILLVVPLVIVLAVRDPQGMGHLVAIIFTIGAKLLDGVATILNALTGSHATH
jgi:hypothetical protein